MSICLSNFHYNLQFCCLYLLMCWLRSFLRFGLKSCLALYWSWFLMLLWLSWFVKLHTLCTMVLQLEGWSICSFLHPYESLVFTPVLTTRIKTAFPLPRLYCRISIADLSASLEPCLVLITHTAHAFPVCTQKMYFELRITQILK